MSGREETESPNVGREGDRAQKRAGRKDGSGGVAASQREEATGRQRGHRGVERDVCDWSASMPLRAGRNFIRADSITPRRHRTGGRRSGARAMLRLVLPRKYNLRTGHASRPIERAPEWAGRWMGSGRRNWKKRQNGEEGSWGRVQSGQLASDHGLVVSLEFPQADPTGLARTSPHGRRSVSRPTLCLVLPEEYNSIYRTRRG